MKGNTQVQNEIAVIYGIVTTAVVSFISWDKRQDKQKLKELSAAHIILSETVARQDERHKALVGDVSEIKVDTKEIKQILMERR